MPSPVPGRMVRFAGRAGAALALALAVLASPAVAAADDRATGSGGDTVAVAINTTDGASVFRLAFAVRFVHGNVVDNANAAVAYASCVDCQTVALAFQVIIATGEANVVTPTNLALAYNETCSSCATFAAATQILVDTDGQMVRFTGEGRKRLAALRKHLRGLRDETLTIERMESELAAARAELADILASQLVPVGSDRDDADDATDADREIDDPSGTDGAATTGSHPSGSPSSTTSTPTGSGSGSAGSSTTSTTMRSTTSTAPTTTAAP